MTEAQKISNSLIPETPVQSVRPPEIQITAPVTSTESLPVTPVAPVAAEQHTIPEASTALPGTEGAEKQNTDPPTPTSSTTPAPQIESGISENKSTDPPFKSLLRSFTQPTTGKPAQGNISASVDPKTGVSQPHENFTPKENFGLVGQQTKAKMRRVLCCGDKDDLHS